MATLTLEIVTPEGTTLTAKTPRVTLPTASGQLTILPGHQPLLGKTVTGEVLYTENNTERDFVVDNGFFMLQGDKLSLLVEGAVDSAAIDLKAIEEAQARAQAALQSSERSKMDPAEVEEFERIVRFTLAQRLVKKR